MNTISDSHDNDKVFDGYLSDITEDAEDYCNEEEIADQWYEDELDVPEVTVVETTGHGGSSEEGQPVTVTTAASQASTISGSSDQNSDSSTDGSPTPKRRRLDIPAREARALAVRKVRALRESALKDMNRLLSSQRQQFEAGNNGLQARRARTIQSCLHMMVHGNRGMMGASQVAAEANGFSVGWGARLARKWTQAWIRDRALPTSHRGQHAKIASIFSEPAVRAAMSSYMWSHKWSMNPAKLKMLLNNELSPEEARDYAQTIVSQEMPQGLKNFVETTILPRSQLKPSRLGLSLATMRRVMLREGFSFMEHKKSVYFDGHERPDVVEDRQNRFIPAIEKIRPRIVKYSVQDVTKEIPFDPATDTSETPPIVLVAHDEMTAQAHDGVKRSWVLDGEMPLKKKGPGRGIHQSDFICSTVGWLKDASVTLEYGKNYDGFWNGELFVKQVSNVLAPRF